MRIVSLRNLAAGAIYFSGEFIIVHVMHAKSALQLGVPKTFRRGTE